MLFSGLDDFFGLSDRSGFPRALGKKHLKEKSTRHWKFACSVSYPRLPPHSLYCSRWLGSPSLSAETLFETLGLARDHGCGGHDVHGRGLEKPLTLPPYPCPLWHHRPWWKIITIVKLDPDLLHWDHHQHIITHSPEWHQHQDPQAALKRGDGCSCNTATSNSTCYRILWPYMVQFFFAVLRDKK